MEVSTRTTTLWKRLISCSKSGCLSSSDVKVYDKDEYNKFAAVNPGELYTTDEQCKMINGQTSYCCQEEDDEALCLRMICFKHWCSSYNTYTAATGTPCGDRSLNKWCFEGQCVTRPAPTKTTVPSPCVDIGWRRWTCKRVSKYFKTFYSYLPSDWCRDKFWNNACCAFCMSADRKISGDATTTTEPPITDCEDKGYLSWKCTTVSAYFQKRYGIGPQKWCLDPNWEERCCAYCTSHAV